MHTKLQLASNRPYDMQSVVRQWARARQLQPAPRPHTRSHTQEVLLLLVGASCHISAYSSPLAGPYVSAPMAMLAHTSRCM